mgnify:CR=1 FL=1
MSLLWWVIIDDICYLLSTFDKHWHKIVDRDSTKETLHLLKYEYKSKSKSKSKSIYIYIYGNEFVSIICIIGQAVF